MPKASGMSFAAINAAKNNPFRTSVNLMNEPEKTTTTASTRTNVRAGAMS